MPEAADAFGHPGVEPRWTHANKDGVGTAFSAASNVWYTIWHGHLTEIYYPTIDSAQIRDVQVLITDGETFFHDDMHRVVNSSARIDSSLGYRIESCDPDQRYTIQKTIIADPRLPCVLERIKLSGSAEFLKRLKLFAVCAPHIGGKGYGNNAQVMKVSGRTVLVAHQGHHWMAMGATAAIARASVGYVGVSDGWTDLSGNLKMDWEFITANDGNVALTAQIELPGDNEFTLGIAFGRSAHAAISSLLQSLALPFEEQLHHFEDQWARVLAERVPLDTYSKDGGKLYRTSFNLLLGNEDKTYQGALPASLSIPWGEARNDEEGEGGYHLAWTRDLVECATGMLAAGHTAAPLRTLAYLAALQLPDGGYPQNMWVDGRPFRDATQLDQVAFPILLARRLKMDMAKSGFDPAHMVKRSARYLILKGPVTQQERWEEAAGYSPSTLAAVIAGLVCAAAFAAEAGDAAGAEFVLSNADWLRSHLEDWTVTHAGSLVDGITRHFVRLNPAEPGTAKARRSVDQATIKLTSQAPGASEHFPARDIVDAGFLVLVRHGILSPDDPLVVDSLAVVDAVLKVKTPSGDAWHRYNHDGYGQQEGGGPYVKFGVGRPWPLLTGERAHYEIAAGRDPGKLIESMEKIAASTGLLPEQIWNDKDIPQAHLVEGCSSGSAAPLLWAHAEYIKILRSLKDGVVFGQFKAVTDRYLAGNRRPKPPEFWSFSHPTPSIMPGSTLRVCAERSFRLRTSIDQWQTFEDLDSTCTYDVYHADIEVPRDQRSSVHFTFFWPEAQRWEGQDMQVAVEVADAGE